MSISFDDLETGDRVLRHHASPSRSRSCPSRERAAAALHAHLGRRPPRRAAAHVRGPGAGAVRRAAPRGVELDDERHGVLALRRRSATTRSGSTPSSAAPRGAQLRAHPLRRDAARRVGHRRPRARHGPQRRLRVAQLPVVARRVRRPALPARRVSDPELALAVVRAANDWHLEEWAGTHPGRIIPLPDAVAARPRGGRGRDPRATPSAASRRSRSPSCPSGSACRRCTPATGTRSSRRARRPAPSCACTSARRRRAPTTSSDAPSDTIGVLFFGWAMFAAVDWLYSKIPVRFPDLKICLSEGGIGWVAGLLDRLDHVGRYQAMYGTWDGIELTPREVHAAQLLVLRHRRPVGSGAAPPHRRSTTCCLESDYPHQDGTWPDTQEILHDADRRLPGRRHPQAHLGERVDAVRPPGARGRAARPGGVLMARPDRGRSTTSGSASPRRGASSTARAATATSAATSAPAPTSDDAFWVTGFEYFDQTTPDRVRQARLRPAVDASRRA